jgi:FixJ family two-component response regulator
MPRLGGVELATRALARQPGLIVLFVSGYADDPALAALAQDGATFLTKPFTPAALVRRVQQMLAGSAEVDAPPRA